MATTCAAADTLTVTCLENSAELADLQEPWNRLAGEFPFRCWDWLEASWRSFRKPGSRLFTLAVHDSAGELIGLAPWFLHTTLWGGRVVRFLGSDEACSDYLSLPAQPGREADVAAEVAKWLTCEAAGQWDLLELTGVDAADSAVRCLLDELRAHEQLVSVSPGLNCWRLQLPDNWDDYLATLSKNRREKCRSIDRKTFGKGKAVLHRVTDVQSLQRGFEVLVDLHQRRRQSLGQCGCFSDGRFRDFLFVAARRFLNRDALRLQWIEVDGIPVVSDFSLVGGECAYGYQSGFNPDYAKLRPGLLMMVTNLKTAIAEGSREFEFLRGNEDYKSHWGADPQPSLQARVVPPQRVARARHRLWLTGMSIKHWVKQTGRQMGIL